MLGMTYFPSEGSWHWTSDNSIVTWFNWLTDSPPYTDQPDELPNADCAYVFRDYPDPGNHAKSWGDTPCSSTYFDDRSISLICEDKSGMAALFSI